MAVEEGGAQGYGENGEPGFWGTHGVQMQGAGGLGLGLRTGGLATQAPGGSIQLLPESCH